MQYIPGEVFNSTVTKNKNALCSPREATVKVGFLEVTVDVVIKGWIGVNQPQREWEWSTEGGAPT